MKKKISKREKQTPKKITSDLYGKHIRIHSAIKPYGIYITLYKDAKLLNCQQAFFIANKTLDLFIVELTEFNTLKVLTENFVGFIDKSALEYSKALVWTVVE